MGSVNQGRLTAYLLLGTLLLITLLAVFACSPPTDESGAKLQVYRNGIIGIYPEKNPQPQPTSVPSPDVSTLPPPVYFSGNKINFSPANAISDSLQIIKQAAQNSPGPKYLIRVGPAQLSQSTNIFGVNNGKGCVGEGGSILPPLTLSDCLFEYIFLPLTALNHVAASLSPYPYAPPQYQHAGLSGITYAASQSNDTDCWAATLETARAFLHLPSVSQNQILADATRLCPHMRDQPFGATIFQISDTIGYLETTYDKASHLNPDFCTSTKCIVESLTHQQPVIMLNHGRAAGHAVLVVGVDYEYGKDKQGNDVTQTIIPEAFYIIDPAHQNPATHVPVIETEPFLAVCRADAFISYGPYALPWPRNY